MSKSIGKNAVLNVIRQVTSVVFPLITFPYLMRVLGAENYGKVTYISSVITYFSLFARLGFSAYATREGAKIKNDSVKLHSLCNEIISFNLLTTLISCASLLALVIFVPQYNEYRILFLILGFNVVFTALSIDWVNVIFEDYYYITIRSIILHLVNFILILFIVKNSGDYYKWAFLSVLNSALICIMNWLYCRKYINVHISYRINIRKHLKPVLVFFAYDITTAIYVNFDVTMLGWMRTDYEVGLYSAAVRIYQVLKNLIAAIYVVAIPRLSSYFGNGNLKEFKNLLTKIICAVSVLLIPACVGLSLYAEEILRLLGGPEYVQAQNALRLLAFAMIFAIYGGIVITCLNVPTMHEKSNMLGSIFSAILNFGLNLYFIPYHSFNGAAFTTLIAEAFLVIFCYWNNKESAKFMDLKSILLTSRNIALGCCLIVGCRIGTKTFVHTDIMTLVIGIPASVLLYFLLMLIVRDSSMMDIIAQVRKKFNL